MTFERPSYNARDLMSDTTLPMDPRHPRQPRAGDTTDSFKRAFWDHLYFTRGSTFQSASAHDAYAALSLAVRDYLVERRRTTSARHYVANPKFVCYLSAEYLLGGQLGQNLLYTGAGDAARTTVDDAGMDFEAMASLDPEPGLGNGGLGRLAACFLDALATHDIPAIGYGIRYEFGIFRQTFEDGWQREQPDTWLHYGYPWEFPQPDDMVTVGFGGRTEWRVDGTGHRGVQWIVDESVLGEPYYVLVPGYGTDTVLTLRLWRARASHEFDFRLFDAGDYARAVEQKTKSENISKVLYPNDHTPQGKELRLRQQYFFVACSIRDILRRFRFRNDTWRELPDKVVIQLNDTHPVLAIPELMRVLMDEERLGWDDAWEVTSRVFASTQHTLLPEALEKWPVSLFARLLPRHLEIVHEINRRFLDEVRQRFPDDEPRVARMSIIEDGPEPLVRMAHLATVGSFSVNGVSLIV
jgi:starch phosphorylase